MGREGLCPGMQAPPLQHLPYLIYLYQLVLHVLMIIDFISFSRFVLLFLPSSVHLTKGIVVALLYVPPKDRTLAVRLTELVSLPRAPCRSVNPLLYLECVQLD